MADESEIIRKLADMCHTLDLLREQGDQLLLAVLRKEYQRELKGARDAGISLDLLPAAIECRKNKTGLPELLNRPEPSAFPYFMMTSRLDAP